MATDATGTPSTVFAFPKYNPDVDSPSGLGLNAIVDDIDSKLNARFVFTTEAKNTNEVPVWNGTAWTWEKVKAANVNSEAAPNGQVLTANGSGGASWAASSAAWSMLADAEITGSDAVGPTWSSISGAHKHLVIVVSVRTPDAAMQGLNLRFNGDTGGTYNYARNVAAQGGTALNDATYNASRMQVGLIPKSGITANVMGTWTIWIPNYTNTTRFKSVHSQGQCWDANDAAPWYVGTFAGMWEGTPAAITSIQVECGAALNFLTGSRLTLYGAS